MCMHQKSTSAIVGKHEKTLNLSVHWMQQQFHCRLTVV